MDRVPFLREMIEEKVKEYLESYDVDEDVDFATELRSIVGSRQFNEFRRKLLRELVELVQSSGAMAGGDEETLTIHCESSSVQGAEETRSHQLLGELESSSSSSLTQEMDYFCSNHEHLSELAQRLDPRCSDVERRRGALRQIVGMPSIEAQVCDAWTVVPEAAAGERGVVGRPGRSESRSLPEMASCAYGIRQGLYDALVDEDAELNFFALKFIAKTFSSAYGNVKECYILFADYLEEKCTGDGSTIPTISDGLDVNNGEVEKLLRGFCLLHEFHKRLPNNWLRYCEKLTEALMERWVSLLLTGRPPSLEVHSSRPERRLTPLHVVSLLDPKAQWLSLWMRSAYGCRRMLSRLARNRQVVSTWMTSCVCVFLRKPESLVCASQPGFYSSSHLEAAYFLHSLHALTTLLCFHETHSKILPVAIAKDVIKRLCDEDKASLIKGRALPMRTFMKLFVEFILSLEDTGEIGNVGENSLHQVVDRCFQRLASSPVATVCCFGLSIDKTLVTTRTTRKGSRKMSSLSDLSKESSRSVVDIMLSRIREFVDDVVKVSGVGDEAVRSNVCVLSQAMANICSTVEGREYFLHPKAARQMEAIAQIVAKCVEVVVANDKLEVFCRESGSLVGIVAKIVGHLGDVLSKTLLLPQSRQSRVRVEVARKMLEVLEVLRLKRGRTSGEVLNVVAMLENSMETFLFALLKTARGVEVVESFGLLSYCAQRLLSPSNLGGKYSWLEAGVLVSQMTSCGEGMRSLEKTCFVEHRLVEVWRLLEGSGSGDATSVEDGEDVESPLDDALDGGRDVDCEALSVADLGERVVLKPLNRLVSVFANFTAVFECLRRDCSQIVTDGSVQTVPKSLCAFMDRAVLLDSATKLGKLCRPDETQMFGLRFLSAIVGSLDTFLLLEWRFGIRRMLLNAQLQNGLDEEEEVAEDGEFVIDEGLIERNRLLVKCSILGGASERLLPPRGICEHSADPYPYPIVAALSSDQMEKYTDKMKQIGHCRRCADDLGAVPMPCKRPTSISLVSVVISSLKQSSSGHWKTEHPILLKCPRLQAKIRNVAKLLSQLNKQTLEVGSLFDVCLRALLGRKQVAPSLSPSSAGSCVLPSWEEVAMSLIIDYGRRVNALDATLPHSSRKQDLAGLLWHAGNARRLGRRSRGSLQHADHAEGSVEEHEVGGGEAFKPFDWFVAVVYLLFNGSTIRAVDFLNRLEGTSLAHYLWAPAAVEMPSSHHYTVCHLFEMVFASELPQLYNTFQLSGYSPSVVLRCWLNQCYVNYLDWSEIEDFLLLCLLCGPGMIVFSAVAMMRHLSMRLVTALQAKNHLQVLLEEPIGGFRFVDNLDFLELLADKYNEEVAAELISTPSD